MSQEYTEDKQVTLHRLSPVRRLLEALLIIIGLFAIWLMAALISFDPSDPSWSQTAWHEPIHNIGGLPGAWLADTLLFIFGVMAYPLPVIILGGCWFAWRYRNDDDGRYIDYFAVALRLIGALALIITSCGMAAMNADDIWYFASGGVIGSLLGTALAPWLNISESTIALLFIWAAGLTLFTGWSWVTIAEKIGSGIFYLLTNARNRARHQPQPLQPSIQPQPANGEPPGASAISVNGQLTDQTIDDENPAIIGQTLSGQPLPDQTPSHQAPGGQRADPALSQMPPASQKKPAGLLRIICWRRQKLAEKFASPLSESDKALFSGRRMQAHEPVLTMADLAAVSATSDASDVLFSGQNITDQSAISETPISTTPINTTGSIATQAIAPASGTAAILPQQQITEHSVSDTNRSDISKNNSEINNIEINTNDISDARANNSNATDNNNINNNISNPVSSHANNTNPGQHSALPPVSTGSQPGYTDASYIDTNHTDAGYTDNHRPHDPYLNRVTDDASNKPATDNRNLAAVSDLAETETLPGAAAVIPDTGDATDAAAMASSPVITPSVSESVPAPPEETTPESLIHPLLMNNGDDRMLPKPDTPLPTLDLLTPPPSAIETVDNFALEQMARLVEARLADFRIKADVVNYLPGPVITRYELNLAPGVKAARITTLARDLARSLSAVAVRVVEVIPGKPYVGLELPNKKRQTVYLREVLDCPQFRDSSSPLSVVLGKDISGEPVVADLAKMPHLLVAGTTGSGKSVGVNAMILSMLYKATPDDVRFIMIDPKMLELSVYEGIPHLLTEVVTDMKDAANALRWSVAEMERRYRLMSALGVRNLAGYNDKIKQAQAMERPIPDPYWKPGDSMATSHPVLEKLPYIVVMVDEFADLMMTVGKKVEELIARLAQKARAAGIHLVLATQRPSVDVITGLIKANIPTRIAFTVSSKIDSRTILDQGGAESLLGMGDMLYAPQGSNMPVRVHGAFVRDQEVHAVVQNWKARGRPQYIDGITAETETDGANSNTDNGEALDPLFDQAVLFVAEKRKASISAVQRQFRIGYNRAARIVEQMEIQGIVSEPGHNGNRDVLAPPPFE